jgi:hypothetical protein
LLQIGSVYEGIKAPGHNPSHPKDGSAIAV